MRWFFGKESRRKAFGKGNPVVDSRQLSSLEPEESYVLVSDRRPDHEGEVYSEIRDSKLRLQLESDLQSKTSGQRLPQGSHSGPDLLSFDEGMAPLAHYRARQAQPNVHVPQTPVEPSKSWFARSRTTANVTEWLLQDRIVAFKRPPSRKQTKFQRQPVENLSPPTTSSTCSQGGWLSMKTAGQLHDQRFEANLCFWTHQKLPCAIAGVMLGSRSQVCKPCEFSAECSNAMQSVVQTP